VPSRYAGSGIRVLDELIPSAWHHVEQYANTRSRPDHSQLKHRLWSIRVLRTDETAQVVIAGYAFMQKSAMDATSSPSTPAGLGGWPRRLPSSLKRSDLRPAL
jgi:hypothetical protein